MRRGPLLDDLVSVVGDAECLDDPSLTASYTTDWTGRFGGEAAAVVRPGSTAEVAGILEVARRHSAAVIPQGGNTGLVGGSVPRSGAEAGGRPQVLLSLTRLAAVEDLDPASRLLLAGAGTTLGRAAASAGAAGLRPGIDLAARGSATLGGMVATNAGGLNVLRFGPMRDRLAGFEAVLADGTVVEHLSGLAKDSVGWDLGGLLAGSEGTLAVVTRVLLRLEPEPACRVTALVAFPELASALDLVAGRLRSLSSLEAAELTLPGGMRLVCDELGLPAPIGAGNGAAAWLTLEAASRTDPTDELAALLGDVATAGVAVATEPAARARLWSYRERHTEAVGHLGVPHKLDVSVRPARLGELVAALPERLEAAAPRARLVLFGHAADGNLHVNIVGPGLHDDRADDAVLRLVAELGGSISAEHGIGVAKRRWLRLSRSPGYLDAAARVRLALDPERLLNPGVLEPPG